MLENLRRIELFMKKNLLVNNKIIILLFLSAVTAFYSILPLLVSGSRGMFFSIDPDVHYIASSLYWIKSNQIQYINHPGTPSILFFAYLLLPLRIYAKLIEHTNFISWYITHPAEVYYYLRIAINIIYSFSLFIFLYAIYFTTRSFFSTFVGWVSLFCFGFFPYLGAEIRSESTSFFIIALWLFCLSLFIKSANRTMIFLLAGLSGLAVANKFTNISFFIVSMTLPMILKKEKRLGKLKLVIYSALTGFAAFIFSTWPIRQKYPQIFRLMFDLFTHTDKLGGGKQALFDWSRYTESVIYLIQQERWIYIIMFFTLLLFILLKNRTHDALKIISLVVYTGIIIFAKYPESYYQTTHYLVVVFILSYLFKYWRSSLKKIFAMLLFIVAVTNLIIYNQNLSYEIFTSISLENFISAHPSKGITIWEWGKAKDFALLWGNSWSGGNYSQELATIRPDLLTEIHYFKNTFPKIYGENGIFSLCWNQLYVQKRSLNRFMEKDKLKFVTLEDIPNSGGMVYVVSNHCSNSN